MQPIHSIQFAHLWLRLMRSLANDHNTPSDKLGAIGLFCVSFASFRSFSRRITDWFRCNRVDACENTMMDSWRYLPLGSQAGRSAQRGSPHHPYSRLSAPYTPSPFRPALSALMSPFRPKVLSRLVTAHPSRPCSRPWGVVPRHVERPDWPPILRHTPHIPHERHTSRSGEYGCRRAPIGVIGRPTVAYSAILPIFPTSATRHEVGSMDVAAPPSVPSGGPPSVSGRLRRQHEPWPNPVRTDRIAREQKGEQKGALT